MMNPIMPATVSSPPTISRVVIPTSSSRVRGRPSSTVPVTTALIKPAIEELMRRHHIANVSRVVTDDIDYKGVTMKAGDMVLTATTLAGLDERRFPAPFTVDFDRPDKRHLVFGKGVHTCIGAFLARTELNVFLSEWLARIPDFAIAPGEKPIALSGRANAVSYLPLVWDMA